MKIIKYILTLMLGFSQVICASQNTASGTPKIYPVPELTGLSVPEAAKTLKKAGFTLGSATDQWHGSVPVGRIIGQKPAPGDYETKGTAIDYRVSACIPSGGSGSYTRLVWNDEFDDTPDGFPNPSNWKFDTGFFGNSNRSFYCFRGRRAENCFIRDGVLHLRATGEGCDCKPKSVWKDYSSGSIRTQDLHSWTHGRFETRAKLPRANGTWPAIWMGAQVRDGSGYGHWPDWGEIDIMEAYGKNPGYVSFNLHTKLYYAANGNKYHGTHLAGEGVYDDFHVYALEWFPDRFDWYFDDQLVYSVSRHDPERRPLSAEDSGEEQWKYWPFDKPFFFWLSLQYGRPNDMLTEQDIALLPQTFEVDYVRVYQEP